MSHLPHLEDVLLEEGSFALHQRLHEMTNASLKWDGIAVVCGTDEHGQFVSTNSYFNKTPKLYRSINDINELVPHEALRHKLISLYNNHPGSDKVNLGDLLWYPGSWMMLDSHLVTLSNIIQYHIPLEFVNEYDQVGVAWHTDISGNGLFESPFYIEVSPSYPLNYTPNPVFDSLITPKFTEVMKKFLMKNIMNQVYSIDEQIEDIDTIVDNLKKPEEYQQVKECIKDNFRLIIHEIQEVMNVKHGILFDFNNEIQNLGIKTRVVVDDWPFDCNHEGFVSDGEKPLKFVDRYQFSRLNRLEGVRRGWAK